MQAVGHFFRLTGKGAWETKTLKEGNKGNRMVVRRTL